MLNEVHESPAIELSQRDRSLLLDILLNRTLTRDDLRERHFPGRARQVAERRINKVIERFADHFEERRVGASKRKLICAKAMVFGNTTYPEHDFIVSRIRFALEEWMPESKWFTETEVRLNAIPNSVSELALCKRLERIPDGVWIPSVNSGLIAIEYEHTAKDRLRVKDVLLRHEADVGNPFRYILVFCATTAIAKNYSNAIDQIGQDIADHKFRTKVIDLTPLDSLGKVGSPVWREHLVTLASEALVVPQSTTGGLSNECQ